MRAFVTGATGFLGSHLVRMLIERGYEVTGLVRSRRKGSSLPPQVELVAGDLTDDGILEKVPGTFDLVFHLGAAISGDWEYHRRVTVEGTRRLVEFARRRGTRRFVLVSSLAVYDKSGGAGVLTEQSPVCPSLEAAGPYAWGKLEAERLVAHAAGDMEWVVARPGLIYGPGHLRFVHLGPKLGPVYLPFGGGGVRLPLTHVESVCDALVRLAEAQDVSGRVFNIVDEEQPTKRRYVRELSRVRGQRQWCAGIPAWPLIAAARAVERVKRGGRAAWLPGVSPEKIASRTVEGEYDCSLLRQATGWAPAYGLGRGLAASLSPQKVREPVRIERVALIGAGRMAEFHLRALKQVAGVRVTGILDQDLRAARAVAERHGIPLATDDAEALYREARPQMVHVLTPPGSHAKLALEAIGRGCHVLVEKPMALSVQEAQEITSAARARGVTAGVDHNYAADPRVLRARRMIDSGSLGEIVHIEIFWGFDIRRFRHVLPENGRRTWAMDLPGGLLEDLMPHPLSIALALANEDVRLHSWHVFRSGRHRFEGEDEARLLLRGRNCTIAVTLTLSAKPDDLLVNVHGTRATVKMDVHNMTFSRVALAKGPKAMARGLATLLGHVRPLMQTVRNVAMLGTGLAEGPASVGGLVREHYAALAAGQPLPVDAADGLRVAGMVREIWPAGAGAVVLAEEPSLNHSREEGEDQPLFTRIDRLAGLDQVESHT